MSLATPNASELRKADPTLCKLRMLCRHTMIDPRGMGDDNLECFILSSDVLSLIFGEPMFDNRSEAVLY